MGELFMSEVNPDIIFSQKCQDFLARIERLDSAIERSRADRHLLRRLQREKADTRREFAAYLRENDKDRYQTDRWNVCTGWRVDGVPSRKGKQQASAWMGSGWSHFAPHLRDRVKWALRHNKPVPAGYFGLHVEWTVELHQRARQLMVNNDNR